MSTAPKLDPFATQLERLLDALRPGQEKARFAGWGREMRSMYGRLTPATFRGAVTRYLVLEDDLPRPHQFAAYVDLAERHLERAERERQTKLAPPPEPDLAEQQATTDRIEAAKEAARGMLPERLRKRRTAQGVVRRG